MLNKKKDYVNGEKSETYDCIILFYKICLPIFFQFIVSGPENKTDNSRYIFEL